MKTLQQGRKIHETIETPLNNVLIQSTEIMDPYMKALNLTPTFLTLSSFFFQLYGIQQLTLNNWGNAVFYLFIGLVLDVYDGNFARRHNMTSEFGARLDSATDLMTFIILMWVMFDRYSNKKCSVLVSFVLILFVFSKFYTGCRDRYLGNKIESIISNQFKGMCNNMSENDLEGFVYKYKWLGTSHIYILAIVVIFMFENKVIT